MELNAETIFLLLSPKLLKLQERVLSSVVLHLLGDEDPRVRHVAAASLVRYVPNAFPCVHIYGEVTKCYESGERGNSEARGQFSKSFEVIFSYSY